MDKSVEIAKNILLGLVCSECGSFSGMETTTCRIQGYTSKKVSPLNSCTKWRPSNGALSQDEIDMLLTYCCDDTTTEYERQQELEKERNKIIEESKRSKEVKSENDEKLLADISDFLKRLVK